MQTANESGRGRERMSDTSFRAMSVMFRVRDAIRPPGRVLAEIGIRPGMTVVDYGCGPGSYIGTASASVGAGGTVYAVDIHDLAIDSVRCRIQNDGLKNVIPVLAQGYNSGLPDRTADLIYAFDMVHHVGNPGAFLAELKRIAKPDGVLVIDDGHQARGKTREMIRESSSWIIIEETRGYFRCRPVSRGQSGDEGSMPSGGTTAGRR